MGKNNRNVGLDIVRSVAIMLVVVNHVIEKVYPMNISLSEYSIQAQIFAYSIFSLGRLGVPLFLFLTGSLVLKKSYDSESCIKFWKDKWFPMLMTWELWIILYNVFNSWNNIHTILDITSIFRQMIFLEKVPIGASWYMPVILGIYIFIPFVSSVVQKFEWKILCYQYKQHCIL